MNNKFDELTKAMAQSVTRRAAFKKFGVSLAGMALACFGLANNANAAKGTCVQYLGDCSKSPCCPGLTCQVLYTKPHTKPGAGGVKWVCYNG